MYIEYRALASISKTREVACCRKMDGMFLLLVVASLASAAGVVEPATVYRVRLQQQPTVPQPDFPLQEVKCRLTATHQFDNNSVECESNINNVFTDIVDLTIDNRELQACDYQLDCADEDCPSNRTGQLCKTCVGGLSNVLGGPGCRECNNLYLLLIIPFALVGLILVFLILKCNLTVSNGQLNSILFYANVLHVYRQIQFREFGNEWHFFSVFISWLNLDLGIETCFYKGMDSYDETWLQFAFPAYLWVLIFLIIILNKTFPKFGGFLGGNAIPSLTATVIILTYAKIALTVKTALSFSWRNDTMEQRIPVWYEDDSVEYLGPKHALLFAFAIIIIVFYLLPITLIGLFAPCLQVFLRRKYPRRIKRLKPWLDAYQAPYNNKFQHWTGLMLLIRALIYLLLAINKLKDTSLAYFLIVTIVGPIAVYVTVKKNKTVYRRKFLNTLEAISLLNLTLLNLLSWFLTTTIYTRAVALKQYITYVSIAVTMVLFMMIMLYQVSLIICPQICFKSRRNSTRDLVPTSESESDSDNEVVITTSSFIQDPPPPAGQSEPEGLLREPLIEPTEHFSIPGPGTVRTFAHEIANKST